MFFVSLFSGVMTFQVLSISLNVEDSDDLYICPFQLEDSVTSQLWEVNDEEELVEAIYHDTGCDVLRIDHRVV